MAPIEWIDDDLRKHRAWDHFKREFGSWTRIEPRCRLDDFARGLEARVADPLWMLARQWQMGEFQGEDNGSPIRMSATYHTEQLQELQLGKAETRSLDGAPPLEVLVERMPIEVDWRTRVRIGQQFEAFLRSQFGGKAQTIIGVFREHYSLMLPTGEQSKKLDRATQRFLRVIAGRVIDGQLLLEAFQNDTLPSWPAGMQVDHEKINKAQDLLHKWYSNLYSQPDRSEESAWRSRSLDHRFTIRGQEVDGKATTLEATEYRSGELDWQAFSLHQEAKIHSGNSQELPKIHVTPTRVSFPGMPHHRWWTLEDAQVDFGALDVNTTSLAHLELMQFTLLYADDWFLIPLPLPVGSLTRIKKLVVTNVFGETTEVERGMPLGESADRWELFALSGKGTRPETTCGEFLFLPPALNVREESPPLEEVRFLRDEGANMVWAVEHTVSNGLGNPIEGFEAQTERRERTIPNRSTANGNREADPVAGGVEAVPVYRLAMSVPDNWIPYLPINKNADPMNITVMLCQAKMEPVEGVAESPNPMTRIIQPNKPGGNSYSPVQKQLNELMGDALDWLDEEKVPRAGVKIQLTKQRARWIDGKTYVWLGRKVVVGRGEGSSGLKFDYLKNY